MQTIANMEKSRLFGKVLGQVILYLGIAHSLSAQTAGRYGDITLTLEPRRPYKFNYDEENNRVQIFLKDSTYEDLAELNHYNEVLLSRVLIRDHGEGNFEITLFLRDSSLRAKLYTAETPFRLLISVFDHNFTIERDPITQRPLSGLSDQRPARFGDGVQSQPKLDKVVAQARAAVSSSRYKLLKPPKKKQETGAKSLLKGISRGRGKAWKSFPFYIYPMSLAIYNSLQARAARANHNNNEEQLANLALNSFMIGDERRALKLYQRVLFSDPGLFERNVHHLWAIAEVNFGQANLSLADNYYQNLVRSYPASPFSVLAKLRRLDIKAIRNINQGSYEGLSRLVSGLENIDAQTSESISLREIRRNFWSRKNLADQKSLPIAKDQSLALLKASSSSTESRQTEFLARSIYVKSLLIDPRPWEQARVADLVSYINAYYTSGSQKLVADCINLFKAKFKEELERLSNEEKYKDIGKLYETIPKANKKLLTTHQTKWLIAEAYRKSQNKKNAIPLYKNLVVSGQSRSIRIMSSLWLLNFSATKSKKTIEKALENQWEEVKPENRAEVEGDIYRPLNEYLHSKTSLNVPSKILLEIYMNKTEKMQNDDGLKEDVYVGNPKKLVKALDALASKFGQMQQENQKQKTLALLAKVDPEKIASDEHTIKVWVKRLLEHAESLRESDHYLRAGELYTIVATHTQNWDKRAEAFYKGGLLLFRGGQRQKAVEALTAASKDGNNIFYAQLAKERLNQIDN